MRAAAFFGLIGASVIYGFAFAIFSSVLLLQFITPLILLTIIFMWMMPDGQVNPERALAPMFNALLVALLCWPDYLALALPGLPWITARRLVLIPMAAVLVYSLATSEGFRRRLIEIGQSEPAITVLLITFNFMLLLSIGLSKEIFFSASQFVIAQLSWTAVLLVSSWYFSRPGKGDRFAQLVWFIVVFCCAIGAYEAIHERLPWAGRIPSFLKVEDENVQRVLAGVRRGATGEYRVQSRFGISIGFGEFLAMATPFIIHYAMTRQHVFKRAFFLSTLIPIAAMDYFTHSRLALIGLFSSLIFYFFYWAIVARIKRPQGIWATAFLVSYPAAACAFVALSFAWRRLEKLVWGGGAEQSSNDVRKEQLERGIDILFHNPVGHGVGMANGTLGYVSRSGIVTIDSHILATALEIGVVGVFVYYGAFVLASYKGAIAAIKTSDHDLSYLAPASVALLNFLISKTIFYQQENHPFVYVILGLTLASLWRIKNSDSDTTVTSQR